MRIPFLLLVHSPEGLKHSHHLQTPGTRVPTRQKSQVGSLSSSPSSHLVITLLQLQDISTLWLLPAHQTQLLCVWQEVKHSYRSRQEKTDVEPYHALGSLLGVSYILSFNTLFSDICNFLNKVVFSGCTVSLLQGTASLLLHSGFSLVAVSRSYSLVAIQGLFIVLLLLLWSVGSRAHVAFSNCGSRA